MRPSRKAGALWVILVCAAGVAVPAAATVTTGPRGGRSAGGAEQVPSAPASARGAVLPAVSLPPGSRLVDTVVSNTDPNLTNNDFYTDWEPSIAVDPAHPQHIVILAFSSCWSRTCDAQVNAAMWSSLDGGATWTKRYSLPPPPGVATGSGCPCDQTPDYGRGSKLYGTFMVESPSPPSYVYTGSTTNPASASAWAWQQTAGTANATNAAGTDADQPQLAVGPSPAALSQDNVYVAYDDFATSKPTLHVVANPTPLPSGPTLDRIVGVSSACCINPGLRLATAPTDGAVYALSQQATYNGAANPKIKIQYRLNRSTDGGNTWTLNGSNKGIQLASVPSDQIYDAVTALPRKFGTVNAIFGGIDSVTVDPTNGDVYVVYGARDLTTGKNRLSLIRLQKNASGGLTAGPSTFVTGQVESALPSIAVAQSGQIGVLYDTYNGTDAAGFPKFSAHLARSTNHGATFSNLVLSSWSSVTQDNSNPNQRVLGDYQQLKTTGMSFYGTFTANGAGFGRPVANADPIFFMVPAAPAISSISPTSEARGATGQQITINGRGFRTGAIAGFGGGVTVSSTVFNSSTKLTATVNVSSGASVGSRTVSVTNPNQGVGTCAACFNVT